MKMKKLMVGLCCFGLLASIALASDNREQILRKELKVEEYEAAVKQNPDSFEALKNLAECYSGMMQAGQLMPGGSSVQRKYKKLYFDTVKRLDEKASNNYEYYLWKARNSMTSSDNYKTSLDSINRAIELAPDKPELYFFKESYLSARKDWDGAIEASEKHLQLLEQQNADKKEIYIQSSVLLQLLYCKGRENEMAEILARLQNGHDPKSSFVLSQWYHLYKDSSNKALATIFHNFINDPMLSSAERGAITSSRAEEGAIWYANHVCSNYGIRK